MADIFQLFDPKDYCQARLPLNVIQDEFTFAQFAPLQLDRDDGGTQPVVIPRDVIAPEVMEALLNATNELPYKVDLPDLRGGFNLIPEWKDWNHPQEMPNIAQVPVTDPAKLLENREIILDDGSKYPVDLRSGHVKELLTRGSTVVFIDNGAKAVEMVYQAELTPSDLEAYKTVQVDDLYGFLSHPRLTLGPGSSFEAHLTEQNIRELSSRGISKVTVRRGELQADVFVNAGRPASGLPSDSDFAQFLITGPQPAASSAISTTGWSQTERTAPMFKRSYLAATDRVANFVLPQFELVIYFPYRQTWKLLGYSRGELLNSLSLGPQEETTIEIFTWNRVKRSREDTVTIDQESVLEVAFTDKSSQETIKEMAKEFHWNFNHKGAVEFPIKMVQIKADHTIDVGEKFNELDKTTRQDISEATRKASARLKATRQTKITESEEFGREEKVTRKVKNPNMCHTLNLDYFEILANYEVRTDLVLDQVALCVLTPQYLPAKIDRHFLLKYEAELKNVLLARSVHEEGFEAARLLAAQEEFCLLKCAGGCECEKPGDQPGPPPAAGGTTGPVPVEAVTNAANDLRRRINTINGANVDKICRLANDTVRWGRYVLPAWMPGSMSNTERVSYEKEWEEAKVDYHRWLYRKVALEFLGSNFWNAAKAFALGNETSPQAVEAVLLALQPNILAEIFNLALLNARFYSKALEISVELLSKTCINMKPLLDNIGFDDAGLGASMRQARQALDTYKAAQAAQAKSGQAEEDKKKQEAGQVADQGKPEEFPLRELAQARVAEQSLIDHLLTHESYYRQAIWEQFDPRDRYKYLATIGDLTGYVRNEVLGFVGEKAALPLVLNDSLSVLADWFKRNVTDNAALKKDPTPQVITLPTQGVVLETRLGDCDGCEEFIQKHRELDLAQKAAEVKLAEERLAQAKLETRRFRKRLDKNMLEDPETTDEQAAIRVILENKKDGE